MAAGRKDVALACNDRVALEALKGLKSINALVSYFETHPTLLTKSVKRVLQTEILWFFYSTRREKPEQDHETLQARLCSHWTI